jgi:hypothetical protein
MFLPSPLLLFDCTFINGPLMMLSVAETVSQYFFVASGPLEGMHICFCERISLKPVFDILAAQFQYYSGGENQPCPSQPSTEIFKCGQNGSIHPPSSFNGQNGKIKRNHVFDVTKISSNLGI